MPCHNLNPSFSLKIISAFDRDKGDTPFKIAGDTKFNKICIPLTYTQREPIGME